MPTLSYPVRSPGTELLCVTEFYDSYVSPTATHTLVDREKMENLL